MTPSTTVSTELELRLVVPGGPSLPVLADLRYAADDPWAVRVAFRVGTGEGGPGEVAEDEGVVEWMFARQLLTEGMAACVGDGDVRVWPASSGGERYVNLAMASPSGSALFEIDRDELVGFLQQTYLAVATGAEEAAVDIDAELALLLSR